MTDGRIVAFRDWVARAGDGRYQPDTTRELLRVDTVERDSAGGVLAATGPLVQPDGALSQATFTVPMRGRSAATGEYLLVARPRDEAVGADFAYVAHASSPYPGAGLVVVDANLPPPTNLAVTSAIVKGPGTIRATATVTWTAVGEKYQPSGYTISFRVNGGPWADRRVPHLGGAQQCNLGADLPPGATLDVHARAAYNWAGAESVPTADVTHTLAADTASPGSVIDIEVLNITPNQLHLTLEATVDSDLLLGYIYQIATSAGGPAIMTTVPLPAEWDAVLAPGTYYVAAYPVSKAGVAGGRMPATGYYGPFTITDQSKNLDTTAPAAMTSAPTLATRVSQAADNAWHGYMTVTRPSYTPPADLQAYEISIVVDDGRAFLVEIPAGTTVWDGEVGFGGFTVAMRARDQAGNRPAFSPTATATIAAPALSNTAPTVATSTVGLGIKVSWNRITGALGYEVQRATDSSGSGATTIGSTDALSFFDPLTSDTVILPTYYYRVRATSVQNGALIVGTYSGWVAGTAGAVDGQNLRAASVTAAVLAANSVTANKILAGAVTAAKLEADLILGSMIRTGTNVTRWEIEGATGGAAQNQIRAIERIAGVDYTRLTLTGAGLFVFSDAGNVEGQFYRDSTGHARFSLGVNPTYLIPAVDLYWAATDGKYTTSIDLERARFRFRAGTVYLYADAGTFGSSLTLPIFKTTGNVGEPIVAFQHGIDSGSLYIRPAGIGVYLVSTDYQLMANAGRWEANVPLRATGLHAGPMPGGGYNSNLLTLRQSAALGTAAGDSTPLSSYHYPSGTSGMVLRTYGFRGQANTNRGDARVRFDVIEDGVIAGGGVDLGFRGADPFVSLHTGGTARAYWDHANTRMLIPDNLRVDGSISKGSGSFVIPDPTPGREGWELRHCFYESADRGGTLVRLAVEVAADGSGATATTSNHDDLAATVEDAPGGGYRVRIALYDWWQYLNEFGQVMVNPVGQFAGCWGEVVEDGAAVALTVEKAGRYAAWLSGTRIDPAARAWWDRRGLRKTVGQQWTNENTLARRAEHLERRAKRAATPTAPGWEGEAATVEDMVAAMKGGGE